MDNGTADVAEAREIGLVTAVQERRLSALSTAAYR